MSGGSKAPNAPDLSGNINSQNSTAATATSNAAQTFNTANAYNQNAQNTLSQVNGASTPLMNQVNGTAQANLNQYQNSFLPLQNQQVQQAQNYTSAQNVDQLQGQATADQNASLQASLANQRQQLASEGVDPASVHGSALGQQAAVQGAAANAQAANQSYLQTQATGNQLVANANQMGLQVGQAGTTGAQAGSTIGTQMVGNTNQTNATGINNLTAANPYLATSINANQSGANIANTQFQDQMTSQQAQQASSNSNWAAVGTLGGMALGEYANSEKGGAATGGPVSYDPRRLIDRPSYPTGQLHGGGVLPRQAPNMYAGGGVVMGYDSGGMVPTWDLSGTGGGAQSPFNGTGPQQSFGATPVAQGQVPMGQASPFNGTGPQQSFASAAGNWDAAPAAAAQVPVSGANNQSQPSQQATSTPIPNGNSFVPSAFGANVQGFANGFAMTQGGGGSGQTGISGASSMMGGMDSGGMVTNQGALPNSPIPGSTDTKPAWLTPGEFVIPRDVASWKGHEYWYKEMDKARTAIAQKHGLPPPVPAGMTARGR